MFPYRGRYQYFDRERKNESKKQSAEVEERNAIQRCVCWKKIYVYEVFLQVIKKGQNRHILDSRKEFEREGIELNEPMYALNYGTSEKSRNGKLHQLFQRRINFLTDDI